jgi:Zn-dependent protease with chaperone function
MRVNGLFDWVEHNNTRSAALLLGFVLLMQPLASIGLLLPLLRFDPAHAPWYHWGGYALRYVPAVTLAAAALFAVQMWWHVKTVRRDVGFRFVDNADEPRLCALVEPLSIAAGIPQLYVGVIDSQAMNAFACGILRKQSVIVFTRGIIDGLDDDELSSVIAHELMHIRNGDARLIAAANVFLRDLAMLDRFGGWKPRRYRHIAALLLLPALFLIYLGVALLSQLCLRLGFASRLLISSAREFVADAEAVRLTQHPSALVSALQRIHGNSAVPGLPVELDAMMIDGMAQGRLATHPPIMDRIQAIVAATGQMALDARPRLDTRGVSALRAGGFGRAGLVAQNMTALERAAAVGAAPRARALRAFREAGDDRLILGLRWDFALAMVATFVAAMAFHDGEIGGVLGPMGHVLELPATLARMQAQAQGCRVANWHALTQQKARPEPCNPALPAFAPGGSALSATELAMLSPAEIDRRTREQSLGGDGFMVLGRSGRHTPDGPVTDLMPSYPMPVHEAWQRLAQGSVAAFLHARQCGILVHAHVTAVADQSVTWSITSETVEQIRLTATLAADGADRTRVTLAIADFETTVPLLDSRTPEQAPYPVSLRPALMPPLRPYAAAALNAMLDGSSFQADGVVIPSPLDPGTNDTANFCASERSRLARGEHLSIHDTPGRL